MDVVIDRFEENLAIVEAPDGAFYTLDRALLPGAKEGDVVSITINKDETEARRKRIRGLMDSLFED
jgi:hypothetical protein